MLKSLQLGATHRWQDDRPFRRRRGRLPTGLEVDNPADFLFTVPCPPMAERGGTPDSRCAAASGRRFTKEYA